MKWIKANRVVTIVICVAVTLCLFVVLSYLSRGSTTPAGKAIQTAAAFVKAPLADAAWKVQNELGGLLRFQEVVRENEALKEENARLQAEIIEIKLSERDLQELRSLANSLHFGDLNRYHRLAAARIISWDGANWFNVFTIDAGQEQGVYRDAVVVDGDGLVGVVSEVGDRWAKVIAIIDETNRISFKVLRDLDLLGVAYGDGAGELTGFMLDNMAGVVEGDLLITSGVGMYPEGIPIGKIKSVENNPNTQLKTIEIEPSANFKTLQKVAVVL